MTVEGFRFPVEIGWVLLAAGIATAQTPVYSHGSLVSAASGRPGSLTPNCIATLYGTHLSYSTRSLASSDLQGNLLPDTLGGTGVRVFVGNIAAQLYFVSPTQVNFLVPALLKSGPTTVRLARDGNQGPTIDVTLNEEAPELFEATPGFVAATRPDGSAITRDNPAKAGDVIVLYATGLGRTNPPAVYKQIAPHAALVVRRPDLKITFAGRELSDSSIFYAGVTPGFAGLYQINVTLPDEVSVEPEIRVGFGAVSNIEGVKLAVK